MVHGTTGGSPLTTPASSARLCELLDLVRRSIEVPEDRPGRLVARVYGIWSLLRVIEVDKCSAESVGWSIRVLQLVLSNSEGGEQR